jgi:hypothetical protein
MPMSATRLELDPHGVDPHQHGRTDLDLGPIRPSRRQVANRRQVREPGDRRAEEDAIAPPELRRRRNHRAASAKFGSSEIVPAAGARSDSDSSARSASATSHWALSRF